MGSAVALDVRTGRRPGPGVEALLRSERFRRAASMRREAGRELTTGDEWRPIQNRAISGQYPPGSTYKADGGARRASRKGWCARARSRRVLRRRSFRYWKPSLLPLLEEGRTRLGGSPPVAGRVLRRVLLPAGTRTRDRSHRVLCAGQWGWGGPRASGCPRSSSGLVPTDVAGRSAASERYGCAGRRSRRRSGRASTS